MTEWGWIALGILAGTVVALFLPRIGVGAPRKPATAIRDPEEMERRLKSLATDVDDGLEKMARLYDRIRKRAKIEDEPAMNGAPQFRSGAEVFRYAREKGLIK